MFSKCCIQQFTLHSALLPDAAICGLDFNPLAARADDRLDELPIRVLVSAINEFGEPLTAVRSFVVSAGKIQWAERIVRRANDEQTGESAFELTHDVAQACRFEGRQLLSGAAAQFRAASAQLVRAPLRR